MKIQEFQSLAIKTKAPLGSQINDSIHMVVGMCTELAAELPEAIENDDAVNIKEELGDAEWYIVGYADTWGLTLPNTITFEPEVYMDLDAMKTVALLQDLDKKEFAYKKVAPIAERERLINLLLRQVEGIAFAYGIDTDDMRFKIIEKLKARYGEKFSEEAAITRNLDVEREILEKDTEISFS